MKTLKSILIILVLLTSVGNVSAQKKPSREFRDFQSGVISYLRANRYTISPTYSDRHFADMDIRREKNEREYKISFQDGLDGTYYCRIDRRVEVGHLDDKGIRDLFSIANKVKINTMFVGIRYPEGSDGFVYISAVHWFSYSYQFGRLFPYLIEEIDEASFKISLVSAIRRKRMGSS